MRPASPEADGGGRPRRTLRHRLWRRRLQREDLLAYLYENAVPPSTRGRTLIADAWAVLGGKAGGERWKEAAIRLLIVDDNPELCDILENYFNLTSEITVCGVARDGEEALFRIAQSQPDVVLLDLIMPKLDGITVHWAAGPGAGPIDRVSSSPPPSGRTPLPTPRCPWGADYYMIKPYLRPARQGAAVAEARRDRRTGLPHGRGPGRAGGGHSAPCTGLPLLHRRRGVLLEQGPCSIVKDVYAGVAERF